MGRSNSSILIRLKRQAFWSVASSSVALIGVLAPTIGLGLLATASHVALVVYWQWAATVVAVVTSFGLNALAGPLSALDTVAGRSVSRELVRLVRLHSVLAMTAGVGVAWLTGLGGSPLHSVSFGIYAASISSQLSSNNLLGGALRNDLVAAVNLASAIAVSVAVFVARDLTAEASVALIAASGLVRLSATAVALRQVKAGPDSKAVLRQQSWVAAYLLSLLVPLAAVRLEVPILEARAFASDVASFGASADLANMVRAGATSAFAVLIPAVAFGETQAPTQTKIAIARLGVAIASMISLAVWLLAIATSQVSSFDELLGDASMSLVSIIGLSAGLQAMGTVLGQTVLASRRLWPYVLSLVPSMALGLAVNVFLTRDAVSAAYSNLLTSFFIVLGTALALVVSDGNWSARRYPVAFSVLLVLCSALPSVGAGTVGALVLGLFLLVLTVFSVYRLAISARSLSRLST